MGFRTVALSGVLTSAPQGSVVPSKADFDRQTGECRMAVLIN